MKKLLLFIMLSIAVGAVQAQTTQHVSNRKARKWMQQAEWRNGFDWQPHSSINKKEFWHQYNSNKRLWDTAFRFLATQQLATLEKGDYPLAGDSVVVKVSYGPAKEERDANWEAHKKYIDVQLVASGAEKIGVAPLTAATLTTPFDAAKDIANYTAAGKYYTATPGMFFIFFPQDVHRPGLKVADGAVRKIVVKIIAAE